MRLSAQKQAKDAQLSSTLEQLETLWVSSGQAALTPRRSAARGRAEAEPAWDDGASSGARPGAAVAVVVDVAALPAHLGQSSSSLSGGGTAAVCSSLSGVTPAVEPTGLAIPGQALGAGRSLSPGTSQLLSKVYGAAASRCALYGSF